MKNVWWSENKQIDKIPISDDLFWQVNRDIGYDWVPNYMSQGLDSSRMGWGKEPEDYFWSREQLWANRENLVRDEGLTDILKQKYNAGSKE